jgi:hypothetical protein
MLTHPQTVSAKCSWTLFVVNDTCRAPVSDSDDEINDEHAAYRFSTPFEWYMISREVGR